MQFREGGAPGPNGRDIRAAGSGEQVPDPEIPDPDGARGSLMARYRGAGMPTPAGPEDEAPGVGPGPAQPHAGGPAAADKPWRAAGSSGWNAPPVPPAPPGVPAPPPPAARPFVPVPGRPGSAPEPPGTAPETERPGTELAGSPSADPADTAYPDTAPGSPASGRPATETATGTAGNDGRNAAERAGATTRTGLLSAARTAEFRDRWREVQGDFVDDPSHAVRSAGALAREVLEALATEIADSDRVESWRAGDGKGTEDLRVALRRYRTLVDRLLEL